MNNMAQSGEISAYRQKMVSRVASQQKSREASSQGSARSRKPGSNEKQMRDSQMRKSQGSKISGAEDALSEEEQVPSAEGKPKLNEKEMREAQREAERRRVVAAKLTDDRTRVRKDKISTLMQDRDAKKNTPEFVNKYFGSFSGKQFLVRNPPLEVPPEVMTRMK